MIGDRNRNAISVDSYLSSRTIRSRIIVSRDLRKYFKSLGFFSSYDAGIVANDSILNIPVLSIVLPFAWITGADVYVDELDSKFTESMNALQQEYKKMYSAPFKTRLIVDRLVQNNYASNNTALLFSGGLDATYSVFSNINAGPMLIMIFGMDIRLSNIAFQKTLEREYSNFAKREGLTLSFVRTNAREVLNERRVNYLFRKYQGSLEGNFWVGIGYLLGHVGQTAPLSIGRFSHLLVASRGIETKAPSMRENPDASFKSADEKIMWASLRVKHDGNIPRHQKAFALRTYLDKHKCQLRPCINSSFSYSRRGQSLPSAGINCNECPKCLQTIAELALAGIDPNECGFTVDQTTFNRISELFQKRQLTHHEILLWWKPLQEAIPNEIEDTPPDAKQFFEWFKTIDLNSSGGRYNGQLTHLYHKLPYPLANMFELVYQNNSTVRSLILRIK